MKSREISTWKRGGQKAENISLTKNDDAPVVVVAPDSRKIVVVVVVVRGGSLPRSYMFLSQFFNYKRGARLISNEPRPRTFHLHEAGSYEALRGVPCGLARQLTTARTLRSEHDATKRSKPWWSWS